MPVIAAVSGIKNTGKTTLITRLIPCFTERGLKTAVIKHDGHEFEADVPGTDSWSHKRAGAYGTAVFSAGKFMVVKEQRDTGVRELMGYFPEADVILLEGFKNSVYPKVELVRRETAPEPVCDPCFVMAYVTDIKEPHPWKDGVLCFDFDEVEALADFLLEQEAFGINF